MKMRLQLLAVLTFFILVQSQVQGQGRESSDKAWPSLVASEKVVDEDPPRFIIESRKLER
jgi:hypothetical protein